jgi:hypothetical protein
MTIDTSPEAVAKMLARIVKPLVWNKYTHYSTDDNGGPLEGVRMALEAWASGPFYKIIRQRGPHGLFLLSGKSDGVGLAVPTLAAAQAAAQSDYHARLADALDMGAVVELVEAARKAQDIRDDLEDFDGDKRGHYAALEAADHRFAAALSRVLTKGEQP